MKRFVFVISMILLVALLVFLTVFLFQGMADLEKLVDKDKHTINKNEQNTNTPGDPSGAEGDFVVTTFLSDDCFATLVIDDNREYLKTGVSLYTASGEHVVTLESAEKKLVFNLSSYVDLGEEYYVIGCVWDADFVRTESVSDKKVIATKYNICTYCGETVFENNVCLTPGCPGA